MNFSGTTNCLNCREPMEGSGGEFSPDLTTTFRSCKCGMKAIFYRADENLDIALRARRKDYHENVKKTKQQMLAVFTLAEIEVLESYNIENEYSGDSPWLLASTKYGLIKIGWRKRVINIDWSNTKIKYLVEDEVTKDSDMAHAWSYNKAVEYLTGFRNHAERL